MRCFRCGDPVDGELYVLTEKERCLKCTLRAYKFVIATISRDNEAMERKISELKSRIESLERRS